MSIKKQDNKIILNIVKNLNLLVNSFNSNQLASDVS
jgi:hypothetical protein